MSGGEMIAPGREPGLMLALTRAGGVRALARKVRLAPASVQAWPRVPRERVFAVAEATGLEPEAIRPDLSDWIAGVQMERWMARAREKFGVRSGMTPGGAATVRRTEADGRTFDLMDLGLIASALRFAAQERGLQVRGVIGAPGGGSGGVPSPEQAARSYGMALAVVVGRVSAQAVAEFTGLTRQAVDNATERYLRRRDGDDPELIVDGFVIERGRWRAARVADAEVQAAERRFIDQLAGDA